MIRFEYFKKLVELERRESRDLHELGQPQCSILLAVRAFHPSTTMYSFLSVWTSSPSDKLQSILGVLVHIEYNILSILLPIYDGVRLDVCWN